MIPGLKAIPSLNGAGSAGTGASGGLTLSLVAAADSVGSTITIPAAAQAGDWAALFSTAYDTSGGSISETTPSGWSILASTYFSNSGKSGRAMAQHSLLTGTPGGAVLTGMDENYDAKILLVFRPSRSISSVITPAWNSQGTTGDPTLQTVTVSGVDTPLIVFAQGFSTTVPAFTTETPAMTNLTKGSVGFRLGYTIYNSSPSNQSIDTGDNGLLNILQSGYVRFT